MLWPDPWVRCWAGWNSHHKGSPGHPLTALICSGAAAAAAVADVGVVVVAPPACSTQARYSAVRACARACVCASVNNHDQCAHRCAHQHGAARYGIMPFTCHSHAIHMPITCSARARACMNRPAWKLSLLRRAPPPLLPPAAQRSAPPLYPTYLPPPPPLSPPSSPAPTAGAATAACRSLRAWGGMTMHGDREQCNGHGGCLLPPPACSLRAGGAASLRPRITTHTHAQ